MSKLRQQSNYIALDYYIHESYNNVEALKA